MLALRRWTAQINYWKQVLSIWWGGGQAFIANPDLVARFRNGWPLDEPDRATYYGGDAKGYIDYPTYVETTA